MHHHYEEVPLAELVLSDDGAEHDRRAHDDQRAGDDGHPHDDRRARFDARRDDHRRDDRRARHAGDRRGDRGPRARRGGGCPDIGPRTRDRSREGGFRSRSFARKAPMLPLFGVAGKPPLRGGRAGGRATVRA